MSLETGERFGVWIPCISHFTFFLDLLQVIVKELISKLEINFFQIFHTNSSQSITILYGLKKSNSLYVKQDGSINLLSLKMPHMFFFSTS